jgi:hypothetical protein
MAMPNLLLILCRTNDTRRRHLVIGSPAQWGARRLIEETIAPRPRISKRFVIARHRSSIVPGGSLGSAIHSR